MPVYIINPGAHLVRANSRSQALRFVAEKTLVCEVAKGETIAELMAKGAKCEDARTPETADLPLTNDAGNTAGSQSPTEAASTAAPSANGVDTVSIEGIDHVF